MFCLERWTVESEIESGDKIGVPEKTSGVIPEELPICLRLDLFLINLHSTFVTRHETEKVWLRILRFEVVLETWERRGKNNSRRREPDVNRKKGDGVVWGYRRIRRTEDGKGVDLCESYWQRRQRSGWSLSGSSPVLRGLSVETGRDDPGSRPGGKEGFPLSYISWQDFRDEM